MQIFKLRRAETLLCVAVGNASLQLGLESCTVRGGSGNMAGIWRNCTGLSALSWGSNIFVKIFSWNAYIFLCASNPRTPNRKVGGIRNAIHNGMGRNIMPVPTFELPEMLIHNLFWCWFCWIIYRCWTTIYAHNISFLFWNSFKYTHGFTGTVWHRPALWTADYQHEIPYQETSVVVSKANIITCERCQIYNTTAYFIYQL